MLAPDGPATLLALLQIIAAAAALPAAALSLTAAVLLLLTAAATTVAMLLLLSSLGLGPAFGWTSGHGAALALGLCSGLTGAAQSLADLVGVAPLDAALDQVLLVTVSQVCDAGDGLSLQLLLVACRQLQRLKQLRDGLGVLAAPMLLLLQGQGNTAIGQCILCGQLLQAVHDAHACTCHVGQHVTQLPAPPSLSYSVAVAAHLLPSAQQHVHSRLEVPVACQPLAERSIACKSTTKHPV